MECLIDILLPVYNGAKFLPELLESLRCQTCHDFRIMAIDDGSNDDSTDIIAQFLAQNHIPGELIHNAANNGIINSINILLEKSTAPYVMFCDQDDVWREDKIEKSLRRMRASEQYHGSHMPVMVFTDMYAADRNMGIISRSCLKYQNLKPENTTLNRLLLQNVPSGCTLLVNRPLLNVASRIPDNAVMFDHWLALTASAFGRIEFLNEPTLYYRQHGENFTGARRYGWKYFYDKCWNGITHLRERFYANVEQADAFLERYQNILPPPHAAMIQDFAALKQYGFLRKRWVLIKHRIFKTGFRRNLGTFIVI